MGFDPIKLATDTWKKPGFLDYVLPISAVRRAIEGDASAMDYAEIGLTVLPFGAAFKAAKALKGANKFFDAPASELAKAGRKPRPLLKTKVGKPVYHGTDIAFDEFDPKFLSSESLHGPGFYFTEDPTIASEYTENFTSWRGFFDDPERAPNIWKQRLNIKRPLDLDQVPDDALLSTLGDAAGRVSTDPDEYTNFVIRKLGLDDYDSLREMDQYATDLAWDDVRNLVDNRPSLQNQMLEILSEYKASKKPLNRLFGEAENSDLLRSELYRIIREAGYDGLTHTGGALRGNRPHKVWIAFDKEQIHPAYDLANKVLNPNYGTVPRQ